MAASQAEVPVDHGQVKKAAQALLAHNKAKKKKDEKLLLDLDQNVFLMITVWKIPSQEQIIRIGLPHGIMPPTSEVCLFTKDEHGLTAEQTENLYKKLLSQHGITGVTEVMSYKTLKAEYKPFEAKRRLVNQFSLFLSDDRIRRLLPSQIGKHFYRNKKVPLSVNLKAKNLAKEINRRIQGTTIPISNRGCCYTARVGHTGLQAEEIADNVVATAKIMALKAPKLWKSVKVLHLKTDRSVALPVFTRIDPSSEDSNGVRQENVVMAHDGYWIPDDCIDIINGMSFIAKMFTKKSTKRSKKAKKKKKSKKSIKKETSDEPGESVEGNGVPEAGKEKEAVETSDIVEPKEEEEEEEIPQLVPVERGTSAQKKKQAQSSPSPREGVKESPGTPLGKRKTPPATPAIKQEKEDGDDDGSGPQSPKLLRRGRNARTPMTRALETKLAKTPALEKKLAKTPSTPEAPSSAVTRRMKKAMGSAKKSPETPKRQLRKRNVSQSVQ